MLLGIIFLNTELIKPHFLREEMIYMHCSLQIKLNIYPICLFHAHVVKQFIIKVPLHMLSVFCTCTPSPFSTKINDQVAVEFYFLKMYYLIEFYQRIVELYCRATNFPNDPRMLRLLQKGTW